MKRISVSILVVFLSLVMTAVSGLSQQPSEPAENMKRAYFQELQEHVNKNWSYRKTLDNQFYAVLVSIELDDKGNISSKTIERLSEDEAFNEAALAKIREMAPFPPVPEELREEITEIRIQLMPNSH